jgi:hypothetical protein
MVTLYGTPPAWLDEIRFGGTAIGLRKTDWHLSPMADSLHKRWALRHHRDQALVADLDYQHLLPFVEMLALHVKEDLCVLAWDRKAEEYQLVAACVCSPSRWDLPSKIGKPLTSIHSPVPHYTEGMADKVNLFMDRLQLGTVVTRRNWSIHEQADLWAPTVPDIKHVPVGDQWFRSERQTLSRLDDATILFGILIEQCEMKFLPSEFRERLAHHLFTQDMAEANYHGRTRERQQRIINWLKGEA